MPTERLSRWDTKRHRSIDPERFTPLRLHILEALAYDRFLCGKYLAALCGTSYRVMIRALDDLMSEPYAYLKISDYQLENTPTYAQCMRQFELTELGKNKVKKEFGIIPIPPTSPESIYHQIMGDQAMASFRIGAKESNGRSVIMPFQEIITSPNTPERTRESAVPNIIPLGGTIKTDKSKPVPHVIETDREAFVIRDLEKRRAFFIAGIESGRGTETHVPKDKSHEYTSAHSTTYGKFTDCITVLAKQICEQQFNVQNCRFIFLESKPDRIVNMIKLWTQMTAPHPELRPFVLFKEWHSYKTKYEASGKMLTEPYQIVAEDGKPSTFTFL